MTIGIFGFADNLVGNDPLSLTRLQFVYVCLDTPLS